MTPHGGPCGARFGVPRDRVSLFNQGSTPRARSVLLAALAFAVALAVPPATDGNVGRDESRPDPSLAVAKTTIEGLRADAFLENAGQLDPKEVRFYAASGNVQVGFADSALLLALVESPPAPLTEGPGRTMLEARRPSEPTPTRGVMLRLSFEGANEVTPQGRDPLPYMSHFFLGNDPAEWRTNVRSYREVAYEDLYDGVDLIYRASALGVKYEFRLRAGADPSVITMAYQGANRLELEDSGDLKVHTTVGKVTDASPVSDQEGDFVHCSFALRTPRSYGFDCNGVDRTRALVIDPLVYATFLNADVGFSIAVDGAGNAYVTGSTWTLDFQVTPGAFDMTPNGQDDAFVAKLDYTGSSLLYATYLGGADRDYAYSIAVDSAGNAYVTGPTYSLDFPATPSAFDTTYNGGQEDAFVAKLNSLGSSLLYATYLGGSNLERGSSVAVDGAGNAYVTGPTWSVNFPATPAAFDTTYNGGPGDAFVAKLDPAGSSLLYSTYLGGSFDDRASSIAVDSAGNAYVIGYTGSLNFPVTPGAFDMDYNGLGDSFVAKLDSAGSSLVYATYLGGYYADTGAGIAVDSAGNAYVTGHTFSSDFPVTPGAFDTTNIRYDVFVAKLDPTGSSILYATYLGGFEEPFGGFTDMGFSIAVDTAGNAYVTGITSSPDFPVTPGAFDTTYNGREDAFVAKLDPAGSSLLYSTYLGGSMPFSGQDHGYSIAVDSTGNAFVTGITAAPDFPVTPGAFDTTYNGGDVFVARFAFVAPAEIVSAALAGPGFQDLNLTWTPSPLDGSPGGPIAYRILRGAAPGGPFAEIASLPATGSPSYSYLCPLCGHVPGDTTTTFYRVGAAGYWNGTADSNLAARYAKTVQTGPHLLTVPLEQTDYAVPVVLQTLNHGVVRTFRAGTADPWKAWDPGRWGDLATLAFGDAMWVDITAAGQYTVAGLVRLNPIVPLSAGWNLVGYAAFLSETRDVSLADVAGVARVETFDPAGADPYHLRFVAGTEILVPGEAYWVLLASGGRLWLQG